MSEITNELIQGLATAIPIIGTSLVVLYRIKTELCKQISDLKVEVGTHIKISESHIRELDSVKERLTNIILKNNLKF